MDNQIAMLLMSHGDFANAAMKSAELIVGKQNNYDTCGVFLIDDIEQLKAEMFQKVESLDTSNGLLVFTDIVGGTPMNLASHLLERENTIVCSGLNLPMLLVASLNRDKNVSELKEILKATYKEGFSIRTFEDLQKEEEDDDML